ncbi:sugar transferase [Janibacter anophelis]|uniref:sugar transferase n=1 Tax=Janibacter anophelis TaxID=319054 RepID=UPI00083471C0|nr:sugar transferase [Janibacter anophelis]
MVGLARAVDDVGSGRAALRPFRAFLALVDLVVIVWATFGAQVVRFGIDGRTDVAASSDNFSVSYTSFSLGLAAVWWIALRFHGAYDVHLLGHGAAEYRILIVASLRVFAAVAMLAFALQVDVARGYILLALPAGVIALWAARRVARTWLGRRRVEGDLSHDVLLVGECHTVGHLADTFATVPEAGYRVIGACTSGETPGIAGVPLLGAEREAARVAIELGVDMVACADMHTLGTGGLRRLGWALEGSGIELVVSPGLTEIAGPRVLTRPVAGLPLLHVEAPKFDGPRLALKSTIDWCGALVLIVLFAPLMLVVAAVIKLSDGGPVFFRQQRVGLDGNAFMMTKFRSMVTDAEARLQDLRDKVRDDADGPLFKDRDDPRITRVGRFIRRYSIDELPQLFDVIAGKMSLVGPRPPLPSEVAQYEGDVGRRLLVKPGMTGLWQVNGRSDLSWDEAVRFDLYYVENWSVAQDLIILWRTLHAVLASKGAY